MKGHSQGSGRELDDLVSQMLLSYRSDPRAHRINGRFLPAREEIIGCIHQLIGLLYPGYFGRQDLTDDNIGFHVGALLSDLRQRLARQIELCLCHANEARGDADDETANPCAALGRTVAESFLNSLPTVRETLITDIVAAYDGDPAAPNLDEVILAYPGLLAVTVYRLAHELHGLGVPLMPRIMTEWAHAQTGADIHPGARIGPSFFLDHATGAVVGETTVIGAHVKLYQGVTLGALSVAHDDRGRVIRGTQRHPTVQDGVTVYANATVLGGSTVLGARSIVGGSVFLTRSIPEGSTVALKHSELRVNSPGESKAPEPPSTELEVPTK